MEWILIPPLSEWNDEAGLPGVDRWTLVGVCMELASFGADVSVAEAWERAACRVASGPCQVLLNRQRQPMAVVAHPGDL